VNIYLKGYQLIKHKFKYTILILLFFSLIGAFLEGIGLALILPVVELITKPDELLNNSYFNFSSLIKKNITYAETVYIYISIFFIIFLLKNIFLILIGYFQSKILLGINFYLSNTIFKTLLSQNFLNLLEEKSSTIIRTMISQTNVFALNFIHSISVVVSELLTFFFILVVIFFVTNKELYLVIFLLLFILFLYWFFFKKKIYELSKKTEIEEINRLRNLTNGIDSINEINIFNIKDYFIRDDNQTNIKIIKLALTTSLIRIFPRGIIEVVLILCFSLFVIFTIGNDLNFIDYLPSIAVLAAALFKFIPTLNKSMIAIQRIGQSKPIIENIVNKLSFTENKTLSNIKNKNFKHEFETLVSLKDLTFIYPGSDKKIFNKLNFDIKKNQKIGIFGNTGSGKSTLVKILMGIIPPNSGSVTIDNHNIYENVESWHKLISYIPQKIFLFESSLENNIKLFDNTNSEKKFNGIIAEVFRDVNSFDKLSSSTNNNPSKLSGGETKKVGIARALFKDHEILIIDEGTAGLDKEYSEYVISKILNLKKTIIFISHDMDQLKKFDDIYEIKGQKIQKMF
jgi:ATP-binding cassette, subfamily B, bacterial PglK